MAVSAASFVHPITQLEINPTQPEGLTAANLNAVYKRIARKAGYEQHQGNQFVPQSTLSKFNYFSAGGRNASTTARAYHESGHLLTAAILRAQGEQRKALGSSITKDQLENAVQNSVWTSFKSNNNIQRNFKRQDYINHRRHMLKSGATTEIGATTLNDGTSETARLLKPTHTEDNRFSRIATKVARIAISVCECTSAPTGFTYRVLRNGVFHGMSESGMAHKAGTVLGSIVIGMGATALIKALRGSAGSAGYGFNPLQMVTGVLFAFAAVSSLAGLVSWAAGLASQAKLKNLEPSDEQKQFLQFEMNSTLNKINTLLIDSDGNSGKMDLLNKAFAKKFPLKRENHLATHSLLSGWKNSIRQKNPEDQLQAAKEFLGKYLSENTRNTQTLMNKEKEFATLAGFVEHFEVEPAALNLKAQAAAEQDGRTTRTPKEYRLDGRQFTEEFARKVNQVLLRGLALPAKVIDKGCRTHLSQRLTTIASPEYAKLKEARLKDPAHAHLNKYNTEYIAKNLHQYGPITRSLMKTSDLIHSVNYNYVLAVNAQTSRLFNKIAQWGQETMLGQHSSKVMCGALGRFLGGATVTLVSFFGISALAGLTGGGNPADGFQNMSSAGSAKLSWLVTGTLMTLIGVPAFALGLMAKGAAALEGWKGNIEKPLPSRIARNPGQLITV